ncbi:hypothetical protein GOP47_0024370 [Adiantum capillus-veneris]|uniref:Uncharacterized protein n=1 Tax=Adiantum capillus-veneris TaxID=13818 RepID=A0A9D4Z3L1_ADICA|nr:hypothetical protein GOP47_0024370 [Adiantum capillus-veneris]
MRAYAVAYVDGEEDDNMKAQIGVDEHGGENPNDVISLSVREAQLWKDSLACLLTVDIYSRGRRLPVGTARRGSAHHLLQPHPVLGILGVAAVRRATWHPQRPDPPSGDSQEILALPSLPLPTSFTPAAPPC